MGFPSAPPRSLAPLFAAAEGFVPGMAGAVGGHGPARVTAGADNGEAIAGLVSAIASLHAEGKRPYWSLRAWTALTWQPVVLAMVGVHRLGIVPPVDRLSQIRRGAMMMGYRLPRGRVFRAEDREMMSQAGTQLRHLAGHLLADLAAVTAIKPRLAERLLADRVLAVLLRLSVGRPPAEITLRAAAWLCATGLQGRSGLVPVTLADGRPWLALDRKACCLEYLVDGGGLCASCPRQDNETRLSRMAAEWSQICST